MSHMQKYLCPICGLFIAQGHKCGDGYLGGAVPKPPEPLPLDERCYAAGLKDGREEGDALRAQNYLLRAEMTELLEAVRLERSSPQFGDRLLEAKESCIEYLKYIRSLEAKSRAAQAELARLGKEK